MRPVASTWVASMQNIAAPDSARLLMCVKCQSLASPLSAEYWHIGATMMRLRRFNSRSLIGENRALMRGMSGFFEGGRALQHLGPAGAIASGRGASLAYPPLEGPGGGGSARYRAQRDARRGGVFSQLGHCSKRETVTPPRRSTGRRFASPGRVDPESELRSSRPLQGRVKVSVAPACDFIERIQSACPTSKSLLIFRNLVKPPNQKYFRFRSTQIRSISKKSCPTEGR